MTIETLAANPHQGFSRPRALRVLAGSGDITPSEVLIHSWNELSGSFTDTILGNSATVNGSPERGVSQDDGMGGTEGISTGSSRDVAFSGQGGDFCVTSHLPQYENPRWGIISRLQPDTLAAVGDKQIPIAKHQTGQGGRLTIEIFNDGGVGRVRVGLGAGGFVQSDTGVGTVAAGTATRVGVAYDGTTVRIFQDTAGVIGSEAIADAGMDNNTADWTWGQFPGGLAAYDGILGDTVVYDFDFDQAFFEATDASRSITHDTGAGGGEFTLAPATNTNFENLTHDGQDTQIQLNDASSTAVYSLEGTVRTVDLVNPPSDLTWEGVRCLVQMRDRSVTGGGFYGGAAICTNMENDYNWNPLYQSTNQPRPGISIVRLDDGSGNFTIEGVRLHALGWDGIGFQQTRSTQNVTVLRCGLTQQRDDAIENDTRIDGLLVNNCFFESFVFYSSRNSSSFNGSSRINTFQGCLSYSLPCRIDNNPNTLATIFKLDGKSPRLIIKDCIFAIPDFDNTIGGGAGFGSLINNDKLHHDSKNNTICWLGSGSFPLDNPDASRFTVLTGSTAQTTWDNELADWWAVFPGHRFPFDPPAP